MQPQDKRSPLPPEEQEVPSRGTGDRFERGVTEEVRREGETGERWPVSILGGEQLAV